MEYEFVNQNRYSWYHPLQKTAWKFAQNVYWNEYPNQAITADLQAAETERRQEAERKKKEEVNYRFIV